MLPDPAAVGGRVRHGQANRLGVRNGAINGTRGDRRSKQAITKDSEELKQSDMGRG